MFSLGSASCHQLLKLNFIASSIVPKSLFEVFTSGDADAAVAGRIDVPVLVSR